MGAALGSALDYLWHLTITVWLWAILTSSLEAMKLERLNYLVVRPVEERNCLTLDALMPKFKFFGIEPVIFTNLSLFSWAIYDTDDVPVAVIDWSATASQLDHRSYLELT